MSNNLAVHCRATVPLGLVRQMCGAKFREGEQEGDSALRPNSAMVLFTCILEGRSDLVKPMCWVLFKTNKTGCLADFLFKYQVREQDITVRITEEDLKNCYEWLETSGLPCEEIANVAVAQTGLFSK